MLGLMQDFPLIVSRLLTYAEKFHRHTEIVSRRLEGKVARWSFPDDIVAVESLPLGATGKVQKNELRAQFNDYSLPVA